MHNTGVVEEWKDIPGWGGIFAVSSAGSVRRMIAGQTRGLGTIKGGLRQGYRKVQLSHGKDKKTVFVHNLVLLAFVGPRPSPAHACDHINGIRNDNRLSNLRWVTHKDNIHYSIARLGHWMRGERSGLAVLSAKQARILRYIRLTMKKSVPVSDLASAWGVSKSAIVKAARGSTYHSGTAFAKLLPTPEVV